MRAIAALLGLAAILAGAYGGYWLQRELGPKAPTASAFALPGGGTRSEPATAVPGGGTLFEARNARRVLSGLQKAIGDDARVDYFDLRANQASASTPPAGGKRLLLQVDAAGAVSRTEIDDDAQRRPSIGLNRIRAAAIAKIAAAADNQSDGTLESLSFSPASREWSVRMVDGEPDSFVANLDGSGVRLPGEPDTSPIGASSDSLLRARNIRRVLAAAKRDAGATARVTRMDWRALRVSIDFVKGGRALSLEYDVEAQLTRRDIGVKTPGKTIRLSQIRPNAVERMAASAKRRSRKLGLAKVDYVLLHPDGFFSGAPSWTIYFKGGTYFFADLRGNNLRKPGE